MLSLRRDGSMHSRTGVWFKKMCGLLEPMVQRIAFSYTLAFQLALFLLCGMLECHMCIFSAFCGYSFCLSDGL